MNKRRMHVQQIEHNKKNRATKGVKVARGKKKQYSKKPVIKFRQSLFWDVDPKKIDPQKHATYIIERILDFGNDNEVRWLWQKYPRTRVRDVVKHSRVLHNETRVLWEALTR